MGTVFRAYGYTFPQQVQYEALRSCRLYSRHPGTCRALGCR
jgi:hypothetical protein